MTSAPATIETDDLELCYALGWTDGLPVVPPTRERVEQMLGERWPRRDELIAKLPPAGGVATLEKVAANAVMAGCLPAYLPVVEAAIRAVADEKFWLELVVTCNEPVYPLVLVSGPIADEIGMNGDAGALAGGCRANATIGRAVNLCLQNIGGARSIRQLDEGGLEGTTIGHPGKFSYCYTENVAHSPWPPLSVHLGYGAGESTVTVYAADGPFSIGEMSRTDPELVVRTIAESLAAPGSLNAYYRNHDLWLIMSPEHANVIAQAGWSRADVQRSLFEQARVPRERLLERGYHGVMDDTWPAPWLAEPIDPVPIADTPERFVVTVAGLPHCGLTSICFGFGEIVTKTIGDA